MAFDRFLIAPINSGLQTDLRPWLIPDDAFEILNNVYVFRGRVRKRFGSLLMGGMVNTSRFRINIGTTDAITGNFTATVPGAIFKIGQEFTIGTTTFTVFQSGAMLTTGAATGTFNTTTGVVTITGNGENPTTAVFFYPAEPVMGLTNYEVGPINNQPSIGWDTQFAYAWNNGWDRSATGANPLLHGNNLNFVWSFNWRGSVDSTVVLFNTNFFVTNPFGAGTANDDPIWTAIGNPPTGLPLTWTAFQPRFLPNGGAIGTGPFVVTARIIVGYKDRLVLLNTIENDGGAMLGTNSQFKNRARWSASGSPFAVNAFYEPGQIDAAGNKGVGGDMSDAPTEEQIISAEFIKDRLIVFFEHSTWELAWTGNQVVPFVWQKINTELGAESTFSTVPFDKEILTVGNTGVHSCNGANVQRIDNKIPDEVFEIKDKNEGVKRVAGIRDYYVEMVYWTFPASNTTFTYPNRVLVYNYRNGAWAFNDDCFTAFGYFQQQTDITWALATFTWLETNNTWNSGVTQAQFRQVLAGNQEGFTLIIAPDQSRNAPSMQITNMVINGDDTVTLTVVDHTLLLGDFVAVENTVGITLPITGIYQVITVTNKDTIVIFAPDIAGAYLGAGTLARVSNIQIKSKQWNPYVGQDRNIFLHRIDFGIQKTSAGEITVDYSPSGSRLSMINEGEFTGSILGNNILETSPYALYPLEVEQERLWHPIYFQTSGTSIQIFMFMSPEQIENPAIAWSDFELEGMVLYTKPTAYRLE